MAWQNLLIGKRSNLKVAQGALICSQSEQTVRLPLADIATVTLESPQITITSALLSALNAHGIALITCDETHHPNGLMTTYNTHSRLPQQLQLQIQCSKPLLKRMWQRIVQAKITNQVAILERNHKQTASLPTLISQVKSGDPQNIEAQAARAYFSLLFSRFRRHAPDITNAAMNYGYAIVRTAIARELVRHGLQPALGIHHHNQLNSFNLADDLIEPFRPVVDGWIIQQGVCQHKEEEAPSPARLTLQQRVTLQQLLQVGCHINEKLQRMSNAVLVSVQSFITAMQHAAPQSLLLPAIPPALEIVPLQ